LKVDVEARLAQLVVGCKVDHRLYYQRGGLSKREIGVVQL
jgi:hypothetical protein